MKILALSLAAAAALSPAASGRVLFHLQDSRIDEASGVAVATREAKVWFTHNDSGDRARFFAVGPGGQTLGTYDLDGARNVDWEDMASAPLHGVPTLWFGDIGDNNAVRKTVAVYAVSEPTVAPGARGTKHVSGVRYQLRYPDGAHNAESLLVDPRTAQIYVATKSYLGQTEVYAAPAHPSSTAVNPLTRVASLHWPAPAHPTSLTALAKALATTGGAFAPDGRTIVLRTYTDAYLFPVSGSGPAAVAKALAATPRRIALPAQPQGEGVAFTRNGKDLVLTSEKVGSAVYQVPVPVRPRASTAPSTTAATAAAAKSPSAAAVPSVRVTSITTTTVTTTLVRGRTYRGTVLVVVGALALMVLVAGAVAWRRSG